MNGRNASVPSAGRRVAIAFACAFGGLCVATPAMATNTITQFTYDAGDHVSKVTDPRGLITTYSYDGLGQKWQQISPDTGTTIWNYDSYGRPISMSRADGVQTGYGYDGINRTTSVSAGGQTQTFTYDNCNHGAGRLCAAADVTGTTSYSYSPEGWITGRGFSISGTTYALGYAYNALGQVASVVYPDGNQAIYAYTRGVVSGVTLNVSGTNVAGASAITYQPMNAGMSSWTSSNGLVNTLSYDTDGRLTGISATGVQSLGLSYDAANRIVGITNGLDAAVSQNFGYDEESRLRSVYSDADNQGFQYDADGNRLVQARNGATTTYTTSATSNQLSGLSGALAASYGYTPQGNAATVNGSTAYQYNTFNRLSQAGSVTNYVNPEGQRLAKSGGSTGTTFFAPDADGALQSEDDNGAWIDYVWLDGRLVGRIANAQVYAIHVDQVGRPEAVTDANKIAVWKAQNSAFDRVVTQSTIGALNLGFPGQYYDVETATWNNGFRDYDARLGRYVESDPAGLFGGVNGYVYANNNPVSLVDLLGLKPGDAFKTQRAAALDALNYINPISIKNNVEYAGMIYSANGSYYATMPVKGSLYSSITLNDEAKKTIKDALGTPTGDYHTHGNYSTTSGVATDQADSGFLDDCFSQQDMDIANARQQIISGYMSYLGTPSGTFLQYDPSTGVVQKLN